MIKKIVILLFILTNILVLKSQDLPPVPNPMRLVNDYANILNTEQIIDLEKKLIDYDDSTSNQICIITTHSIGDYTIEQYADEIGEKWGVGRKGKDNGIVVVIVPKTLTTRGQARISVGYGLEPRIPDATAGQIVDYEMIPSFKQNNYYEGITKAILALQKFSSGEFKPDKYTKERGSSFLSFLPFLIIIIIFILSSIFSKKRGSNINRGGSSSFWLLTGFLGGMSSGRGSSWGGSSGGGFGGFGGGSFGGGGASGSW